MDDTEAKQNYLREEIIGKGYDPESFSRFLENKKGEDALNLELWTMKQLADFVAEYKIEFPKFQEPQAQETSKQSNYLEEDTDHQDIPNPQLKEKQTSDPKEIHKENTKENVKEEMNTVNSTNSDPFFNLDINYGETILAKKLKKSELEKHENIHIFISSYLVSY